MGSMETGLKLPERDLLLDLGAGLIFASFSEVGNNEDCRLRIIRCL